MTDFHARKYAPALDFAEKQVQVTLERTPDYFPIYTTRGKWFHEGELWTDWTGGFFAVGGLAVESRSRLLDGRAQAILLQPEPAINGLLLRRRREGSELLFQGRVEPGNVGGMQVAPTVQSTPSNYHRVHGGAPTPYVEWFTAAHHGRVLRDELQSEEGTRYYGKYNRNVVVELPPGALVQPPVGEKKEAEAWLADFKQRLKWHDQEKACLAFMATLHALRDSLPRDEAVYLGAQLPVLLRGLYYEGWHPSARIARAKSRSAFIERIQEGVHRDPGVDAEEVAGAVFSLLAERLPGPELEDAKAATPSTLRMFWPG